MEEGRQEMKRTQHHQDLEVATEDMEEYLITLENKYDFTEEEVDEYMMLLERLYDLSRLSRRD